MSDEHGMLITAAFMHNEIRTPAGSSFDVYSSLKQKTSKQQDSFVVAAIIFDVYTLQERLHVEKNRMPTAVIKYFRR